jgi:hypothetical protein
MKSIRQQIELIFLNSDLDDMVSEINLLPFLPGPILHIEDTDQIRGPAPHDSIKQLEQNPRHHPQLRERVRQCQEHLCHLHLFITPHHKRTQIHTERHTKARTQGQMPKKCRTVCNRSRCIMYGTGCDCTWLEEQLNHAS